MDGVLAAISMQTLWPISSFSHLAFFGALSTRSLSKLRMEARQSCRTLALATLRGRGRGGRLVLAILRRAPRCGAGSLEPRASGRGAKSSAWESAQRLVPLGTSFKLVTLAVVKVVLVVVSSLWLCRFAAGGVEADLRLQRGSSSAWCGARTRFTRGRSWSFCVSMSCRSSVASLGIFACVSGSFSSTWSWVRRASSRRCVMGVGTLGGSGGEGVSSWWWCS